MPVKSSLSKIRQSISYLFFKNIFESLITDYEPLRKTFHGFYIYAIDGDQLALPRSKDLLKEGYCGTLAQMRWKLISYVRIYLMLMTFYRV